MERIASFTIDHTRLKRGLYVSRKDKIGSDFVTTIDIRLKEPNREPALTSAVSHTIEHIGATFLRNHPVFSEKIVYFGPMGCLTGFYLLLKGSWEVEHILPLMRELFKFTSEFTGVIPGATPVECGNYELMNLSEAKTEAGKFHGVIGCMTRENFEYPR
ncbi:MAG: S-ribosylhomocysteine lyase [Candidatus Riflebacteria bacterium]|nr:S-ribosylhomocysteine lyase [Candidatus Riflebacteria bacterium]